MAKTLRPIRKVNSPLASVMTSRALPCLRRTRQKATKATTAPLTGPP
jgi:hypothetical protein